MQQNEFPNFPEEHAPGMLSLYYSPQLYVAGQVHPTKVVNIYPFDKGGGVYKASVKLTKNREQGVVPRISLRNGEVVGFHFTFRTRQGSTGHCTQDSVQEEHRVFFRKLISISAHD